MTIDMLHPYFVGNITKQKKKTRKESVSSFYRINPHIELFHLNYSLLWRNGFYDSQHTIRIKRKPRGLLLLCVCKHIECWWIGTTFHLASAIAIMNFKMIRIVWRHWIQSDMVSSFGSIQCGNNNKKKKKRETSLHIMMVGRCLW